MNRSYLNYNRPLLITLVTLVLFAFFYSRILFTGQSYLQTSPSLPSWQQEQWLEYPNGSEVLYLRKFFYLEIEPEWAFVTTSAIDEFSIYLNGQLIGEGALSGGTPAEVYDVTSALHLGKNTLAIRSESQQKHRSAKTIAKLGWRALGKNVFLSSNRNWRVDNKESSQRHGQIKWFENDYKDSDWINATTAINSFDGATSVLSISSDELHKLRPTNWIWLHHLDVRHMNISQSFELNADNISNAWLAINIQGSYQLTINGLAFPTRFPQQDKMEYFSIAPYLQKGKNDISFQIQSAGYRLDKIAVSGLITAHGSQIGFSIDPKWYCENALCRFALIAPGQYLPLLKAVVLTEPLKYTLLQWYTQFKWFLLVFFASLLLAKWVIPLLTAHNRISFPQASLIYSQPFGFVALLLAAILICNADPRFNLAPYFPVFIPVFIVLIISLLLFQITSEIRRAKIQS